MVAGLRYAILFRFADVLLLNSIYPNRQYLCIQYIYVCGKSVILDPIASNTLLFQQPKPIDVNVIAHKMQRYAVWFGGSMLASTVSYLSIISYPTSLIFLFLFSCKADNSSVIFCFLFIPSL